MRRQNGEIPLPSRKFYGLSGGCCGAIRKKKLQLGRQELP
jgi:hypothetical protein